MTFPSSSTTVTWKHRDGSIAFKLAPLKKSIYSLGDLRQLVAAANRRYLEFISALEDPTVGTKVLDKLSKPQQDGGRTYKGFNFFSYDDRDLLLALVRGELVITGFRPQAARVLRAPTTCLASDKPCLFKLKADA